VVGSEVGGVLGNASYSRAFALEGNSRKYPNRREIHFVDYRWARTYTTTYFMIIKIYTHI
jgi:hypothetical protein